VPFEPVPFFRSRAQTKREALEITAPELQEGQDVDVFLVPRPPMTSSRPNVLEFLDSLPPGPRSAPTWDEVERQFQEERDTWGR